MEIRFAYIQLRQFKYKPNPENVANVPRSSDGAISAKYIPKTAVVTPDDNPTINLPTIINSTDDKIRKKKNKIAPIANNMPHINNAPFLMFHETEKKIYCAIVVNCYHTL